MDSIVEELQLLGLWGEVIKPRKCEFVPQLSAAVRSLLDLYHSTFEEKNDLQESFLRQTAEMRALKQSNGKLQDDCSRQATLIANLKLKEENLKERIDNSSREYDKLRKKGMDERLKWQRRSHLEEIALKKAHQEISSLKDELRKFIRRASSKAKKNEDLLVEVGSIQIVNNHLRVNPVHHEKTKSFENEMLRKTIRRLDASQRHLVEESASISSSLKVINSSVQQAINALKVYFMQEGKHALWDSMNCKNEIVEDVKETPSWLPLLVSDIHQKCAELNELMEALLKNSSCTTGSVVEEAVKKYLDSFCNYENTLDSAIQSICIK